MYAETTFLDAASVSRLLPMGAAIESLRTALRAGLDPEADPERLKVPVPAGQLLLMPSFSGEYAGVKLVSVAPDNAAHGLPRVQGVYVLMDGRTLTPVTLLDGAALTAVRTPAVSGLAVAQLAAPDARRLVVFGTGPQAVGHVEAMRQVRPIEQVDVVGRRAEVVNAFVERVRAAGLFAAPAGPDAVEAADIVCCCTTARTPLFAGELVAPHATVVAIGSHEPNAREVDDRLIARATTVVEARTPALREAGDIIQAIHSGALSAESLSTLADLVTGRVTVPPDRLRLFKGTGMAWQDLVIAAAVHRASVSQ